MAFACENLQHKIKLYIEIFCGIRYLYYLCDIGSNSERFGYFIFGLKLTPTSFSLVPL